ncbi:hypothetical protein SFR_5746 [Streptomyces sp. FR-008]|nr:hypothetical protein SFR_5746 [Streptomyces sp. FR-008]
MPSSPARDPSGSCPLRAATARRSVRAIMRPGPDSPARPPGRACPSA